MFRPHFNIVFFGGGGGGRGQGEVSRVNRALEGSILKLDIQQDCSSRLV